MKTKIEIFETGKEEGIMSTNRKFYPENIEEIEIKKIFLETRNKIGKKYGFDGKKILQPYQKATNNNLDYIDGAYHVISDEDIKVDDLWEHKIATDILILQEKYKNIVVGNQMADCPILIIEDRKKGVTALSHCGAPYINRCLPRDTALALIKEFGSEAEDLYVYIGSNSKKDNYVYDRYPLWATNNDVWEKNIIKDGQNYYINMEGAIVEQLSKLEIKNITISQYDTVTSDKYYSHSASIKGEASKLGQNFVGFFYK